MKKMGAQGIRCAVVAIGICIANPVWAWGPATHAYIAMMATGHQEPDIIAGAMMPDLSSLFRYRQDIVGPMRTLTHASPELLAPTLFGLGFATHNGNWGADHFAHSYHDSAGADFYMTRKIQELVKEFGIELNNGETIIEPVIDYLVVTEACPDMGARIAEATQTAHEAELIQGFAKPLAEKANISEETSAKELTNAARGFQMFTRAYGTQLVQTPVEEVRRVLPAPISIALNRDMETTDRFVARAIEICKDDYLKELRLIAVKVREQLAAKPQYAPLLQDNAALIGKLAEPEGE